MRCVAVDPGTGALSATSATTCSGTEYVLLTQGELDLRTASPFVMSLADGAALSGAIVSVWVSALIVRALARVLFERETD